MFVRLARDGTWLLVRRVKTVDGQPAPDQPAALDTLLAGGVNGTLPRLRELADENARYNLGHIERNFNDPTWVLRVFDRREPPSLPVQGRSARARSSTDERDTPTLIRGRAARRPDRTGLSRSTRPATSPRPRSACDSIASPPHRRDVRPRRARRRVVPLTMSERYVRGRETVTCTASYSNFRRFETSGRLIPPKPDR